MGEKSSTNSEQAEVTPGQGADGDLAARLEQLLGDIESAQEAIAEVAKDAGIQPEPAKTLDAAASNGDAGGVGDLDQAVQSLLDQSLELSREVEAAADGAAPSTPEGAEPVPLDVGPGAIDDEPSPGEVTLDEPEGSGVVQPEAGEGDATGSGSIPAVDAETIEDLDAQLAELTEGLLGEEGADPVQVDAASGTPVQDVPQAAATPPAPAPQALPAKEVAPPGKGEGVGESAAPAVAKPEPAGAPAARAPSGLGLMVARVLAPLSAPLRSKSEAFTQTIGWVAVTTLFMGGVLWAIVMTRSQPTGPVGSAGAFDFSASSVPHVPAEDHAKPGKGAGDAHGKDSGSGHGKEESGGSGKPDAKKDDAHGKKGESKKAPAKKDAKKDAAKKDAGHGEKKSGGH